MTFPGSQLDVCAALSPFPLRSGSADVFVFQKDIPVVTLQPGEVEIKVLAFALGIADVDVILGRSGDSASIGECAGIITAVRSDLTHSFRIGERINYHEIKWRSKQYSSLDREYRFTPNKWPKSPCLLWMP